nr:peptidylprolyl isomerase [Pseudarcicella sp.]
MKISKIYSIIVFILLTIVNIKAQNPLITIGKKELSAGHFLTNFRKTYQDDSVSKENKDEFLRKYIEDQLKIASAQAIGLDKQESYLEQLNSIKKELSKTYINESTVIEAMVKEAYERIKQQVNISHIFLKTPFNASASDTMNVYLEAKNIKNRIDKGERFDSLVVKFSQDEKSIKKGGNLGYITCLQTQYPLENAAYQLSKGQISNPIKSSQGYHILKVNDKRDNIGRVKLAHILISNINRSEAETRKSIHLLYDFLKSGESFENVCRNFSDDPQTKTNGGILKNTFWISDLPDTLAQEISSLAINQFSKPIRTKLGWNIFKLIDKKGILSFEEMKSYIEQKILKDPSRNYLIKTKTLAKIKKENEFVEYNAQKQEAFKHFYAIKNKSEEYYNQVIFATKYNKTKASSFYDFVENEQKRLLKTNSMPDWSEQKWYDNFVENTLLKEEEEILEIKYPDYSMMINDYKESILLNEIENKIIYQNIQDSIKIKKYYDQNISNYQLPARVKAKIITSDKSATLEQAKVELAKSPYPTNKRFPDIYFEKNSAELSQDAQKNAKELLVILLRYKDYSVEITGNIDLDENENISNDRIKALVKY